MGRLEDKANRSLPGMLGEVKNNLLGEEHFRPSVRLGISVRDKTRLSHFHEIRCRNSLRKSAPGGGEQGYRAIFAKKSDVQNFTEGRKNELILSRSIFLERFL